MILTFSDPHDFSPLKLGLCGPPKPLHEYAYTLSLKIPQFCCSGRHCFGKDPRCSLYLLQVTNPFFSQSLFLLCLSAWHPPRGKPRFLGNISSLAGNENDIRQINKRKLNYYVHMGNSHKYEEFQRQQDKVTYIYSWLKRSETEQDPVGFLGTKVFLCPPFLVCRD